MVEVEDLRAVVVYNDLPSMRSRGDRGSLVPWLHE
jgi:hypothetical protein